MSGGFTCTLKGKGGSTAVCCDEHKVASLHLVECFITWLCSTHLCISFYQKENAQTGCSKIRSSHTVNNKTQETSPSVQLQQVPLCSHTQGEHPVGLRLPPRRLRHLLHVRFCLAGQTVFLRPGRGCARAEVRQQLQEQRGPAAVR